MAFVIEGSLDGSFGPWLARGADGPVVLRRSGNPLARTGHAVVADAFARVQLGDGSYDVEPFVPGRPVDAVELDDDGRITVLAWVARGLAALHGAGVGHGALSAGRVRVGPDGSIRLVGAKRGDPLADADSLRDLAQELWDEIPSDVAARLDGDLASWVDAPAAFLPACIAEETPLQPHPLAGQSFDLAPGETAPSTERPPKVQVALVAGLTLILGLLAGSMLAGCTGEPPGPPVEVTVHVPGAIQISAYCGGETTYRTKGANQDTLTFQPGPGDTTTCELEAPLSPVMPLRGQLHLTRSWTYRCDRDGVVLACRDLEARD